MDAAIDLRARQSPGAQFHPSSAKVFRPLRFRRDEPGQQHQLLVALGGIAAPGRPLADAFWAANGQVMVRQRGSPTLGKQQALGSRKFR